jgi:methionyl-tRNA formyltransferase
MTKAQNPLKIIFFGSAAFAIPPLEAILQSGEDMKLLVSMPPSPAGRGRKQKRVPAALWAAGKGIPLLEHDKANSPEVLEELESLSPDLLIVCAFGTFLGKRLLSLGKTPPINIHPSLLPRHRGPAPINWAIIRGDDKTGVSLIYLEKEMDAGPILKQREIPIPPLTPASILEEELSRLAASMIVELIGEIKRGEEKPILQDESKAIINGLLTKKDGRLDFTRDAKSLANLINGTDPWPGAQARFGEKLIKFFTATSSPGQASPGELLPITPEGFLPIGTGSGLLLVSKLQPESKNILSAADFMKGYKPARFEPIAED